MDAASDAPTGPESAQIVLPCDEPGATAAFLTERLGFRVDEVVPAEDPATVVVSGHGVALRLERGAGGAPGRLRLACREPAALAAALGAGSSRTVTAPDGTVIVLVEAEPPLVVPPARPSFSVARLSEAAWTRGRAGMRYRDLLPGRQGGRYLASWILVPEGGPVADQVHFHEIRVQVIYCVRGWVRLVYEDQGEPFTMRAGGLVLQPPRIRHRVLECSPRLEVVEVACPAEHRTRMDHATALPTPRVDPARAFDGQRFVHHEAAGASWTPWRLDGWRARDLGVAAGAGGLLAAHVARLDDPARAAPWRHGGELLLDVVLAGEGVLEVEGEGAHALAAGDAVAVPPRRRACWTRAARGLELLEVTAPATARAPGASDA